nr:hypothetical protein [Tanacetum cinerariifolium]
PKVKDCVGEGGLRSWEWCGGGGVEGSEVKDYAGDGGLRSWEWCGGGGVDWSGGKWWESCWRENRLFG